jgi:gamma-glutamyltranspeptidase/glutathione hydrolase
MRTLPLFIVFLFAASPSAYCQNGEVCARGGVVVSACPLATSVGVDILKRGGNAIDAAVAVGFALAVTFPQAGNIGGGGFMLIRLESGKTDFIDFREKAPIAASRDMYLDAQGNVIENLSLLGPLASGVPGTVAGLHRAHELYGSMPWHDCIAPAVSLARDGFAVSGTLASSLQNLQEFLPHYPALKQFTKPGGSPLAPGDTLKQGDLAKSLELIADTGPDAFYRGPIADCVAEEMRSSGGIVSRKDLEQYGVRSREPVRGTYRGYEIISAPPPSSGGTTLIEILNIVEGYDLADLGCMSYSYIHYLAEAEKRAYADRARYLGDPDLIDNPVSRLISKEYAARLRESIGLRATPSSQFLGDGEHDREKQETTHYSIVDGHGNAVSTSTTLNDSYGSKVVVRGAGFLMNNEMDDFSIKSGFPNLYGLVGSDANAIEPGKRMLSSMAPTIVLRNGKTYLVLGTPGGSTIITTIAQIIIDRIDFGMSLEAAVAAPRFHHQWLPDCITVEYGTLNVYLRRSVEEKGHRIDERFERIGNAQAIEMADSVACGMPDPRGGGSAGGVEPIVPRVQ